jgi:hypothetical protein
MLEVQGWRREDSKRGECSEFRMSDLRTDIEIVK